MPIFWKPVFMRDSNEESVTEEAQEAVEEEAVTAIAEPEPIPIGTPAMASHSFSESDLEHMSESEINERWNEICKALED